MIKATDNQMDLFADGNNKFEGEINTVTIKSNYENNYDDSIGWKTTKVVLPNETNLYIRSYNSLDRDYEDKCDTIMWLEDSRNGVTGHLGTIFQESFRGDRGELVNEVDFCTKQGRTIKSKDGKTNHLYLTRNSNN